MVWSKTYTSLLLCYEYELIPTKWFRFKPMGYVYACYFTYSHNVTIVDHKQDVCSDVVTQWFYDGIWNKP